MGANRDMLDSMVDAKVALDYIEKQASAEKIDPKKMAELLKNFYKDQKKWIAMSTAVGAVGNGIRGAFSEKKEKDGKVHRVKNALKGAAQGATVGLGTGITTSAFHYGDNNKTALETLDDMCMEKEAGIKDVIKAYGKALTGKNVRESAAANKKAIADNIKNADLLLNNLKGAKDEAFWKEEAKRMKDRAGRIPNGANKSEYAKTVGAYAVPAALIATAYGTKKLHDRKKDKEKTAHEVLDDMCMEKEAAAWGAIAKGATSLIGKAKPLLNKGTDLVQKGVSAAKPMLNKGTELAQKGINVAKPTFYKSVNKVGNAFGVKNASGQMNNFFKNHGSSMAQGAKLGAGIGAAGGAVKGLMNGEKDENGKTHRFKNMLSGAAQGAAGGAMIGGGVGTYGSMKSASELLDEMCIEKEAAIAGTTTAAGGVMGAIKGATKGFATGGAKGAIVGALNGGAKGAMAGGIAGGLVDGVSANVKDANDPNRAYQ